MRFSIFPTDQHTYRTRGSRYTNHITLRTPSKSSTSGTSSTTLATPSGMSRILRPPARPAGVVKTQISTYFPSMIFCVSSIACYPIQSAPMSFFSRSRSRCRSRLDSLARLVLFRPQWNSSNASPFIPSSALHLLQNIPNSQPPQPRNLHPSAADLFLARRRVSTAPTTDR